jgi:AmmeMemoRadiSam system protein B
MSSTLRPAAVAGLFYPGAPDTLRAEIDGLLDGGCVEDESVQLPRALIVPHAGYVYSGRVAAEAYAQLCPHRQRIRRVVLLGPSHRVPLRGMALSSATAWQTPLGEVRIDQAGNARIAKLPGVQVLDNAHAREHSLEVQLPFLQSVLDDFVLLPVVLGAVAPEQVAAVLETFWNERDTLFVISSDLSHYLDYDTARRIDAVTCQAIEQLAGDMIGEEQACGGTGIRALLQVAQRHGLAPVTLRLCNSGDTAGDRSRVVGYGAWAFYPRARMAA